MAFRLKPLEMSEQLINQLRALQSQMEKQARILQDLVNQGKRKMKSYTPAMEEAWYHMGGKKLHVKHIFSTLKSLRLLFFHVSCYQKTSNNSHQQVSKLNELAKKKVDLAKALIRAAEKNNKGSEGESSSSKKRKTGWNVGNLLRSKIWSPIGMYFVSLAMLLRTRCFLT